MSRMSRGLARLSVRDRRALRLGAFVLRPVLLAAWGLRPGLAHMDSLHTQVDRERDLLRHELDLLATARSFPVRYASAEHELLAEAPRLFGGPNVVAASAALASYVGGQAYANRVMVQQSETGSPSEAGPGLARLAVEIRAVSDLEGVLGWFQALEHGPRLVAVERLTIQPATRVVGGPGTDQGVLGVAATVVGYALADSTPASPRESGGARPAPAGTTR